MHITVDKPQELLEEEQCWKLSYLRISLSGGVGMHPPENRVFVGGWEIITIYEPMMLTAPCIMFWMRAYP